MPCRAAPPASALKPDQGESRALRRSVYSLGRGAAPCPFDNAQGTTNHGLELAFYLIFLYTIYALLQISLMHLCVFSGIGRSYQYAKIEQRIFSRNFVRVHKMTVCARLFTPFLRAPLQSARSAGYGAGRRV
jgi:hypothetical protein